MRDRNWSSTLCSSWLCTQRWRACVKITNDYDYSSLKSASPTTITFSELHQLIVLAMQIPLKRLICTPAVSLQESFDLRPKKSSGLTWSRSLRLRVQIITRPSHRSSRDQRRRGCSVGQSNSECPRLLQMNNKLLYMHPKIISEHRRRPLRRMDIWDLSPPASIELEMTKLLETKARRQITNKKSIHGHPKSCGKQRQLLIHQTRRASNQFRILTIRIRNLMRLQFAKLVFQSGLDARLQP
jgi:hypothetical protein